jgi:hypothetical protein
MTTITSVAQPASFSQMERSYMEWPDVLAVGETHQMRAFRTYFSGTKLLERENVTDKLVYVSTDERVLRVLSGNILLAVGPGVCTLRIEETDQNQIWRTSKTIAVAEKKVTLDTSSRTKEEIISKYNEYREQFTMMPTAESPYVLGKLQDGMLMDGLRTANFIRYLAGLPDQLMLDQVLNNQAQYGALVLAATDELTHEPRKPLGMKKDAYNIGFQSTKSSNISSGVDTFSEQVVGFMDDLGIHNLQKVGHRRWILHPPLKKIGFGLAYTKNEIPYGVMQVFDASDATNVKVEYDFIAWPSKGYFPTQYFNQLAPWSFTPNPSIYDLSQSTNVSVELTDEQENRTWLLNKYDSAISEDEDFFNVSNSKGGYASAIVFRPSNVKYRDGSTFQVKIKGLKHIEKGTVEISYRVQFFAIPNWQRPDGWSRERESFPTGYIEDDSEEQPTSGSGNSDQAEQPGATGDFSLNQAVQSTTTFATTAYNTIKNQLSSMENWAFLVAGLCFLIIALLLILYLLRNRKM